MAQLNQVLALPLFQNSILAWSLACAVSLSVFLALLTTRRIVRRVVFTLNVTYETPAGALERIPQEIRRIVESQRETRFDRSHFPAMAPMRSILKLSITCSRRTITATWISSRRSISPFIGPSRA